MARKEFTAEEKAEYSAKKQAEIEDIFKRIDEGVNKVFTSEKYMEYLKFASKFTDYSARNTMLINMQRPDATFIGAFSTWKKLGRYVNKGESGIKILAPVVYKTNQYEEYERPAKDEFGNQLYNDDGTEKMETVQENIKDIAFKAAYVFDLSQTNGKDIPEPVTELQGDIDAAKKEAIFTALRKVSGIDIDFENIGSGAKGYYSSVQGRIVIQTGMSDLQTLKTAFHETAHSLLHDPDKKIVTAKSPRNEKEVQAESVAFMVAEKFGMDTSDYSFPYIATWSEGKQKEQLLKALQEIQTAAKTISGAIESELLKMCKRDLSMEEKLADTELNNIQKAEFIIEDCEDRGVVFTEEEVHNILAFAADNEDISETVKFVSDIEDIFWQRESYGYDFSTMIPLGSKEAALEAFDRGEAVYLLYPDNSEGMAYERYEIEEFDGFFGLDKEENVRKVSPDEHLIEVSKEVALKKWDNNLDVYIDGVPAFSREQIENASPYAKIMLADYQFAAELDFDKPAKAPGKENKMTYENKKKTPPDTGKNPNVIGNTPYAELGEKSELKYITGLNSRHADNIAAQLDADGVRFSGLRKDDGTTTITINKADISLYEAAERKVKDSYRTSKDRSEPQHEHGRATQTKQTPTNPNVIGNTPYTELGEKSELKYITGLNSRHADNIAAQLDADGVRFSGLRKGDGTTTITINKADMSCYEAAEQKVKESYRTASKDKYEHTDTPLPSKAPTEKTEKVYYNGLKNRHADNVIKQLEADGIEYSVYHKGTVTNIGIKKADVPRYEAAVEKVKASYRAADDMVADKPKVPKTTVPEKRPDIQMSLKDVPICTKSYLEAKQSGNEQVWRDSLAASKACIKYLNDHLFDAYDSRNLKGLVKDMEEKFGLDRTMYSIAATVQLKDSDLRFSREVKERAREFIFDSDRARLAFLTEAHPVMLCAFYESLIDREKELKLPQPEVERQQLPSHLADKLLLSTERVELRDDHRGIPETHFYQSSANEYHVEGYGWLKEHEYDAVQKKSGLSVKEFADKIDMVNANYITAEGRTGQIDMTKQEYDMLTEKTYSPKGKAALEAAKIALDGIKSGMRGNDPKPVEYYAVRMDSHDRFEVCTISASGNVTPVKTGMSTVAEAKKSLIEIYNGRKDEARVELVHPQTLQEKAEEIRRTMPNTKHEPNFEIYQLRVSQDNAEISFRPMEELLQKGIKPKFSSYGKVYEGNTADLNIRGNTLAQTLDDFFRKFNIDCPDDFRGHSLSVSDVIVLDEKAYYVDRVGFKALGNFLPPEREKDRFIKDLPAIVSELSGRSDSAIAESVDNIFKKGERLGIESAVLKEALYMSPDARVAEVVEKRDKGHAQPSAEAPKQDKPVSSKKMKL